jgi:hypothetical protein
MSRVMYRLFLLSRSQRIGLFLGAMLAFAGCSTEHPTLASGSGRLAGHVGPGRPGENRQIPQLTLEFSDGTSNVKTTVNDGVYTLDLPAGTWDVRSDDDNVCATGLRVVAAARQSADLIWPSGSCQDLSGPPVAPSPPGR